jgi:hypothetical protein
MDVGVVVVHTVSIVNAIFGDDVIKRCAVLRDIERDSGQTL